MVGIDLSSTAEPKSNKMATASTFSYAQAAKGHGASPAVSASNSVAQPQTSQGAASPTAAPETSTESLDGPRTETRPVAAVEKPDADSNIGSESDLRLEAPQDKRTEPRQDDDSGRLDRPWRRTDKGTRSSSTATRSVEEQESRKPRKGKKSKTSSEKQSNDQTPVDKEKEVAQEAPKVELSEAPIPSVNIWHQRKEQQAKSRPLSEILSNSTNGQDVDTKKPAKDAASTASSKENAPINGVRSNRKVSDSVRSDRNGSRGSRLADKDGKTELPPPVEDAASWPTPEIAIKEEQKKPIVASSAAIASGATSAVAASTTTNALRPVVSQDKESQDDGSQGKRQKEKWVTYDYVPSVSFETQLPQMRNSKPRGGARGANGGRTATNGPQSNEKSTTNAAPNKPNEPKDRTKEAVAGANKAASIPPASKRVSMDANNVAKEQKKSTAQSGNDKVKDANPAQPSQQSNNAAASNTRPEGRSDRGGRGGFRGRGAHHAVNSHSQHQHNGASFNNGSAPSRPQGPYSPPLRQGPHGQAFMPPPQRGGRGRSGAGNNFHRMSLPNTSARLPPIQAQFNSYEYPMPGPMSAVPFQPQPYWDNVVLNLLKSQIEYYFSIENLCKDMYLRKRMDSQGFVNLHFITAFKRIQNLTSDMGMVRAVCESSTDIDFVVGEDDVERLRRRSGWQSFVLPMEDRDDFARNNGPSHITFKNRPFNNYGPQFNGAVPVSFGMPPPAAFSPQGDAQYPQFPDGMPSGPSVNGLANGHASGPSQLSADVPDFSPSGSVAPGGERLDAQDANGNESAPLANGVQAE